MKKTREEILRDIAMANLIEIQHEILVRLQPYIENDYFFRTCTSTRERLHKALKVYDDFMSRSYVK